jgi:hypothetical protein
MATKPDPANPVSPVSSAPSYRLIAAGLILLAYLIVAGLILSELIGDALKNWNQILVIFNAVGALATTACGVLLGVEVQQSHVDAANRKSDSLSEVVGRKDAAALEALGHLEMTDPTARGGDPMAVVRATLQRGLAAGSATKPS